MMARKMARSYHDLRSARAAWTRTAACAAGEAFSLPVPIPNAKPVGEEEKEYARICDYRLWLFKQRISGGGTEADESVLADLSPVTDCRAGLDASLLESAPVCDLSQQQLIFGLDF